MRAAYDSIFLTGATGLVGGHVLERLLASRPGLHAFVLVRDPERWHARSAGPVGFEGRVRPLGGDVTEAGLGLDWRTRGVLADRVRLVVHCAADTVFSRDLPTARAVNSAGTAHVVELAASWPGVSRFIHVSTAFVAGRRKGRIAEAASDGRAGFVNAYERSKHEAEEIVRASGLPWVVVRPSAIVCDGAGGRVSQLNAVHRALRLYHNGLASMIPGEASNRIDLVSADHVASCVSALATAAGVEGGTFHACSGDRALTLGDALDTAYAVWAERPEWRRRAVPPPALTDLATYRLFEEAVEETGDARLCSITRSLSHFVPQLALPKTFGTACMDGVLGAPPPDPSRFWAPMIRYLRRSRWAADARRAA